MHFHSTQNKRKSVYVESSFSGYLSCALVANNYREARSEKSSSDNCNYYTLLATHDQRTTNCFCCVFEISTCGGMHINRSSILVMTTILSRTGLGHLGKGWILVVAKPLEDCLIGLKQIVPSCMSVLPTAR